MPKSVYTLWKGKEDECDDALFLTTEKIYSFKRSAFKRAKELVQNLPTGWDLVIIVRKITVGSDICEQYIFSPKDKE